MTTTQAQSHDCVMRLNEQLAAKHNTRIASGFSFSQPEKEVIFVQTEKADAAKRGKPVTLQASYCPFCGINLRGELYD